MIKDKEGRSIFDSDYTLSHPVPEKEEHDFYLSLNFPKGHAELVSLRTLTGRLQAASGKELGRWLTIHGNELFCQALYDSLGKELALKTKDHQK